MKKLLLSMACIATLGFAEAAQLTEVLTSDNFSFARETTYQDVEYTSSVTGIKYIGNACKANSANGGGIQFRTTSGKEAGLVAATNPNGLKIVSVKVTPSTTASTTNQWDVYGNTAAYSAFKDLYSAETAGTLIGSGTTEATVTAQGDFNFFGFRANKAAIYINQIEIVYEESGEAKLPAELSFPEDTYSVNLGEAFAAPALTKATDAPVTYTSSDEAVATVAADGAVTVVAAGTTVITAKAEATDKYYGGTASYTLKVIDPNAPVAIYAGLTDGITDWTVEDGTLPEGLSYVWTWDSQYKQAKASGYYKKAYAVEGAMLISPEINLAGYTDLSLSFSMLANYFKGGIADACSVLISVDGGAFEPLTISEWPVDDFKADWVNTNIDLNSYKDKKIKVAFKYTSTSEAAGTWEVKNFAVEGKFIQSGIDSIATDENAPVEYYNLQGVRVENPENGLYIRRQGNKVTKVIL